MDTKLNIDLENFRLETRAWLEVNCPASMRKPIKDSSEMFWGGRNPEFTSQDQKIWFENMLEKKWIVPYWEKKYGGGGLSAEENIILTQEMSRLGCRRPLFSFGIAMLGPALLKFATEEQKLNYLPEIVEGKIWWCQGYSEPGAGSDLAGLQTKAEDMGEYYLINGSKVWTTYANKADWMFCLVRTDNKVSKHNGISFILIDMSTKGVSVRPIKLISGKSPFCETFFENVRVPKSNLVGNLNEGWTIAKYLLSHERKMIGGVGVTETKKEVHELAKLNLECSSGQLNNSLLRADIAKFEMDETIFELTIQRIIDEDKSGKKASQLSSFFKYYGTELNIKREELLIQIGGNNSLVWTPTEENDGNAARKFCRSKGNTIEGGTSEIQLNIIAKRILNLPT
ncbi:MAG: acyl-CoA dehydrogenase [Flavobacteriaceae bacterium]|nr:acyl-CoA dehydrogenase [Flavobacteriaceae bacterium]|tara:strand:- start:23884 stop:25077 length:1194 start_codon:yes stop_codon:yes gene_type:complete